MSKFVVVIRVFGGSFVFFSGLLMLGLFGWEPPEVTGPALPFQSAMHGAGYFMPIMTVLFLSTGGAFMLNRFVPLASIALFPVSINILLFHSFLEAGQLPVATLFFGINCFMLWISRSAYKELLTSRPEEPEVVGDDA